MIFKKQEDYFYYALDKVINEEMKILYMAHNSRWHSFNRFKDRNDLDIKSRIDITGSGTFYWGDKREHNYDFYILSSNKKYCSIEEKKLLEWACDSYNERDKTIFVGYSFLGRDNNIYLYKVNEYIERVEYNSREFFEDDLVSYIIGDDLVLLGMLLLYRDNLLEFDNKKIKVKKIEYDD